MAICPADPPTEESAQTGDSSCFKLLNVLQIVAGAVLMLFAAIGYHLLHSYIVAIPALMGIGLAAAGTHGLLVQCDGLTRLLSREANA